MRELGEAAPFPACNGETREDALRAVRLASGRVLCWGRNTFGQVLDVDTEDVLVPAPVEGVDGAAGVAAGYEAPCAWLRNGTVRCWGRNDAGQLG